MIIKLSNMKKGFLTGFLLMLAISCLAFDGVWRGEINIGAAKLPLVFNFSEDWAGQTRCTLDSPMQGAKGIPTTVKYCKDDSLSIKINSIGVAFTGRISSSEINGTLTQRGQSFPLKLTPEKSLLERRPQTPVGPFPYTTKDTTFLSADGTLLAGTLTLPAEMTQKTPVVVFVTGSGPQNRDEELFDHRPFAVIADYLARNGVASLRYDDRGVGKSEGDFASADFDVLKSDAAAAVGLVRGIKAFAPVGVIGHSEGGTIALSLASDRTVDFAVSLAGAIAKGKDIIIVQNMHGIGKLDLSAKQKEDIVTLLSAVLDDVINGKSETEIDIDGYVASGKLDISPDLIATFKQSLKLMCSPAYRKLLANDPVTWLGKIKVPVFALNGTLDTQVDSKMNLPILRKALKKAKIKEYPGLNHLFQHAVTGELTEYDEIEETISPEVLEDILLFVKTVK